MDWWTQQNLGCEMSFDELLSVLVSNLFSWFRVLLSWRRNFLEHAGELFLLVLSIVQQGKLVLVFKH